MGVTTEPFGFRNFSWVTAPFLVLGKFSGSLFVLSLLEGVIRGGLGVPCKGGRGSAAPGLEPVKARRGRGALVVRVRAGLLLCVFFAQFKSVSQYVTPCGASGVRAGLFFAGDLYVKQ